MLRTFEVHVVGSTAMPRPSQPIPLFALLLLALAGCGEAPRPVDRFTGFEGRAVLRGELASAEEGWLMVSVFPKGMRMPALIWNVSLPSG